MICTAVLATLALDVADALERKLLGHRPAYDVDRMGKRLFGSARAGRALRWVYGPTLAILQRKCRLPALLFGADVRESAAPAILLDSISIAVKAAQMAVELKRFNGTAASRALTFAPPSAAALDAIGVPPAGKNARR